MKTSRAKLVEFLRGTGLESWYSVETFADNMIKSSLVEIEEEPKEWWVAKCMDSYVCYKNKPNEIAFDLIIHLHSVDQCKKYEKIWNELQTHIQHIEWSENSKITADVILEKMQELEKGEE